ncbi:hypothetical protein WJX79_008476 [Trebouxia sp. C0005]
MRNIPGRLTGRGLFSTHELAKQGWLVDVHREMISNTITVKQLADYLKPVLTAAAGGSLNAYRKPLQTTAIISHGQCHQTARRHAERKLRKNSAITSLGRGRAPSDFFFAAYASPQTSRQVSKDADAAGPIYKHGQNNMMPNWHDRQQATKAEGFQSARHMTRYIKNQSQLAAHSVRLSSPDKVMEAYYSCMNQLVCSALTQLSLRVNCTPAISDYRIAAILEPAGSGAAIVVAFESSKCLMNKRSRLLGSEGFRQQLLSRRGKLFLLTPPKAGVGVKEGVAQEAVEATEVAPEIANVQAGLLRRQAGRAVCREALLAKHGKLICDLTGLAAYLQQELEAVADGSVVLYCRQNGQAKSKKALLSNRVKLVLSSCEGNAPGAPSGSPRAAA